MKIFLKTNKMHWLKYNSTDHKIHSIWWKGGRIAPEVPVGPTNLCCWKTPWWWHLGAETCRSWHM